MCLWLSIQLNRNCIIKKARSNVTTECNIYVTCHLYTFCNFKYYCGRTLFSSITGTIFLYHFVGVISLFVCLFCFVVVCLFVCFCFCFFSVLVLLIYLFWFLTIIFIIIIFLFLCLFLFLPDVKPVLYDDWLRIDCEEKRRGEEVGKPREKMTSIEEMLHYAFKK